MNQYLRSNGLVAGKIPPRTPCAFLGKCTMESDNCPTQNNLREVSFDCPVARMQSLIVLKFGS